MAIAGKGGAAKITTNTIGDVQGWTLDIAADMLDDTELGDSWKSFISGLKEWSGSLDAKYAVQTDTNGQTALQTAALGGTTVSLRLYVNSTKYYSGTAYISNLSIEDPVDDIVSASFDFQGSGTLSYT